MPKPNIVNFENNKIILRLLKRKDLPLTLSWRNQDNIRKWFLNSKTISEDVHNSWFKQYKRLDNDFVFIILAKELDNIPIGQISLYKINFRIGTAEYGRLIIAHPDARGKGYAKQATNLLLEIGFKYFYLKEIYLEVKKDNYRARKVYLDCGFIETGIKNCLIEMKIINSQQVNDNRMIET